MSTVEIRLPGLVALEHTFELPLDHSAPQGAMIEVFARELADPEGREKPFLVYLQGGPGFEASRPTRLPNVPGWVDRALKDFRVLMLDQRGIICSSSRWARQPSVTTLITRSASTETRSTPFCTRPAGPTVVARPGGRATA